MQLNQAPLRQFWVVRDSPAQHEYVAADSGVQVQCNFAPWWLLLGLSLLLPGFVWFAANHVYLS
jgi:hypothetical protein